MDAKTRRGAKRDRWLFRKDGVDFGPCTTERMLEAMEAREIDLGTLVCLAGEADWEPAGTHAIFRDHYARCDSRWAVLDAEESASRHATRLAVGRVLSRGTGLAVVLVAVAGLGAGGWFVWRLLNAAPTGVTAALALALPPPLPPPPPPRAAAGAIPLPPLVPVARLDEPETFDTAGVAIDDGEVPIQRFDFEEGEGAGGEDLSEDRLGAIVEAARSGLVRCAREAADRSPEFSGTKVGFSVQPGRLGAVTVGVEVAANAPFKACVKQALAKVAVPRFGGGDHRVNVPLEVRR